MGFYWTERGCSLSTSWHSAAQLTSPPRYGFWATTSSERQHSQLRQIGLLTWLDVELLTRHFCAITDANTSFNQRTLVVGIPRAFVSPWQATLAGRCFAYQAWRINMLLENGVSKACQLILRLLAPPFIVQRGLWEIGGWGWEIQNPSQCSFKVSPTSHNWCNFSTRFFFLWRCDNYYNLFIYF